MKVSDFSFQLPNELIARHPMVERSASRLLSLDATTGTIEHLNFSNILDLINADDLLIFNDTRVIPARMYGEKERVAK